MVVYMMLPIPFRLGFTSKSLTWVAYGLNRVSPSTWTNFCSLESTSYSVDMMKIPNVHVHTNEQCISFARASKGFAHKETNKCIYKYIMRVMWFCHISRNISLYVATAGFFPSPPTCAMRFP